MKLIAQVLDDPERLAAVVAHVATTDLSAHPDAERLAAALEGSGDAGTLAHLIVCDACAERARELAPLLEVDALPQRVAAPPPAVIRPAALFAHVRRVAPDELEIVQASGPTRVRRALELRAGASPLAVAFRDAPEAPRLELAVVPTAGGKMSVLIEWMGTDRSALIARANRAGRVLAEHEMSDGAAVISELRAGDVRVDVLRGEQVLGMGWLRVEVP